MKKVISTMAIAAFLFAGNVIAQEQKQKDKEKKECSSKEKKSCDKEKKGGCCAGSKMEEKK
jgi:hypothetical protein